MVVPENAAVMAVFVVGLLVAAVFALLVNGAGDPSVPLELAIAGTEAAVLFVVATVPVVVPAGVLLALVRAVVADPFALFSVLPMTGSFVTDVEAVITGSAEWVFG